MTATYTLQHYKYNRGRRGGLGSATARRGVVGWKHQRRGVTPGVVAARESSELILDMFLALTRCLSLTNRHVRCVPCVAEMHGAR